jgi:hypothetical protein
MESFRRYTNLAATIHLLENKCITLLNPATWDDKNDAYFMAEFKRYTRSKTVLALCFAECSQTYHHWRVFSHGSDGVCIEFDKQTLLSYIVDVPGIKYGSMNYKKINDIRKIESLNADELPFIKRQPYAHENEFRIIYTDDNHSLEHKEINADISCINRITLSPWMPSILAKSVRRNLKAIAGCSELKVYCSYLRESERWKQLTARVIPNCL